MLSVSHLNDDCNELKPMVTILKQGLVLHVRVQGPLAEN